MPSKFLEVNGSRIHYLTNDVIYEPKVVLFHGARFGASMWDQLGTLVYLRERGITAVSVDFPGFGLSEKGNWKDLSEFIHDFLQTIKWERPSLLGPSMGGNAVLKYAVKYRGPI